MGFFVGAGRQFGWFWLGGLCGIGHGTAGVLESITLAGDLDDLGVVQKAVEDRGGGWHVADEFAPVFHKGRLLVIMVLRVS